MSSSNNNLYAHFKSQFEAERELLCTENDESVTYAQADEMSAKLVNVLREAGASQGDRVSVQVQKSPEALCLYLACLRGGFVLHPLNPAYRPGELEYFLSNAEPSVVVCDPEQAAAIGEIAGDAVPLLTLAADGSGSLTTRLEQAVADDHIVHRSRHDLAALLYSSGTTGVPKGIMLSHENLLSNTRALVSAWGFTKQDRLLHALPIFHVHGLFVATGCVMLSGGSMRWLAGYTPEATRRYLPECTVMMGVPTYYTRLLSLPDFNRDDCESIRLFVSGSAPLLAETFSEFEKRTGHQILERYGMTETNMNTSNPLRGERKPGTVGPPLPGVEVRVVGATGRTLAAGKVGDLQVRGPHVFKGYWRMPEKTDEDFTHDGYFNTGDKASIDGDGYVTIVGRSKDLVITGGLNVYPKEVELFLDTLPGIRESAVIGVPHADFGEAVVAIVVASGSETVDEGAVIAAAREHLANFKVPKRVLVIDELPRNSMSKVQKNVLRDKYAALCM